MRIKYIEKSFHLGTLVIIKQAEKIMMEYREQGYSLTLRQLYYQFVARGIIPNKQKEYHRLSSIIGDARLAGLLDWDIMEDRGRYLLTVPTWKKPVDIIKECVTRFTIDLWEDQDYHIEVWVEKEALIGVVRPVCARNRVGAYACKGYVSLSEMWDAAYRRFAPLSRKKRVVIIHLGDHDPSGIDMTRDVRERLELLSGAKIEVERIALNMDQVDKYDPPPNPAKLTDSRYGYYKKCYGESSWELDALEPNVIEKLITESILKRRDDEKYNKKIQQENKYTRQLIKIAENMM